jgi:RES domain
VADASAQRDIGSPVRLRPTSAFFASALDVAAIAACKQFGRIYHVRYPESLGFGRTPSRFSDRRRLPEDRRFGVLYAGSTLKVCFVETILRDRRNGAVGDYPIDQIELTQRRYVEIIVTSPLRLVDLRGDGPIRMGVPSNVVGAASQSLARIWSVAFHGHPDVPDGIIYPSRLNEEINIAIYDRAIVKLRTGRDVSLVDAPGMAKVLNDLNVALV